MVDLGLRGRLRLRYIVARAARGPLSDTTHCETACLPRELLPDGEHALLKGLVFDGEHVVK